MPQMPWVIAAHECGAAAASDLAGIGSTLSAANAAAAFPTSTVLAAGADEVSAAIAALFGAHAQAYQAISAQAALFHDQFVALMNGGASQYAAAEAANVLPFAQAAQSAINDPVLALTRRPLFGDGANRAAGTGLAGAGELVVGQGGVGGNGGVGGIGTAPNVANGVSGASGGGGNGGNGGHSGWLYGDGGAGGNSGAGTDGLFNNAREAMHGGDNFS